MHCTDTALPTGNQRCKWLSNTVHLVCFWDRGHLLHCLYGYGITRSRTVLHTRDDQVAVVALLQLPCHPKVISNGLHSMEISEFYALAPKKLRMSF